MIEPKEQQDSRGASADGPAYSKDSWDLLFEQLGRRRLFRLGLTVLALLYAAAIYAPLIANDRPYLLDAIHVREYTAALRSLSPVTSSVVHLLEQSEEDYQASRGEKAPATRMAALALEETAAEGRLGVLEGALLDADRSALTLYRERLERALQAGREGDREVAVGLAVEAKDLARTLRTELAPVAEDGTVGVALRGSRRYPLFDSISHWEVLVMVIWFWLLTWPVWNPLVNRFLLDGNRERVRRWRRRKWIAVLGSSALAALLWAATVGGEWAPFATAPFKSGLDDGGIVLAHGDWRAPRAPIFAPLPMGYAETHPEESFRPPTWTRAAEVDGEGRYVQAARSPRMDRETARMDGEAEREALPNPVEVRFGEAAMNAGSRHLAGTDSLGRDLLVRMLWGARVSLSVGILSALLLTVIGVVVGALAGYFGGWVDVLLMRLIEILQSIPAFFLIIVTMAFTDPEVIPPILSIVLVIAVIRWTGVARLVRGEFLKLREAEFVLAAKALGYSEWRTMFVHILPNAMGPVLVSAAFAVAAGILTESAVSYLGFGIQHPGASWGSLVNESKSAEHWWVQIFPGLLILLTVTCYNLVGDAVRDALDPKMKVEA